MKYLLKIIVLSLVLIGCKKEIQPNIIYILADDLGYGELGVYGQNKIKTPHIDALAKTGKLFTQHYSGAPVCAPSRAIFLTGQHSGHVAIRGNDEWTSRGDVWNYEKAVNDPNLEGQYPMPKNTITLGKVLQESGYKTAVIGKWGLGAPNSHSIPTKMGFDYFYGYNCQRQAHNLYPPHLWENETKVLLNNELITKKDVKLLQENSHVDSLYLKFTQKDYAPILMHDKAISFINDNASKPFFLYYASPLPHLPLQAPKKLVDEYVKIFGEEEPYIGNRSYYPTKHPRATYAAMISLLDAQVGDIIKTLKEKKIYKNTIIVFTSDNGPTYPGVGGADTKYFKSAKPFQTAYGFTKGFTNEGGIRVPFIVSWPNRIKGNTRSNVVSSFYDMMPTFSELANSKVTQKTDGVSLVKAFVSEEKESSERYLYWEFPSYGGQQAVRLGKWKGIRKNMQKGNTQLSLYNLEEDLQENIDIAKKHPEVVNKILKIMEKEHIKSANKKFQIKAIDN